ncbi:MAG: DNA repair and recombination protein RadB [Candidatus Woesearchaeota archaeon]|jgi:DNA repair protein RadB|nr:DNA repair and recombination protein RadB [Candidatus Woesearchaeota archaeon]MDP7506700.1 DNA repair and recombination protein RadB [Candidatus Woesearchaeota archaeon]|tara:strand:- start:1071 stop:1769 length:699 start_codon:yes stop_codon:yes gene_type:complete
MRLPSGSKILDRLLEGGYEKDTITTIYGPAGSGKTNLCILCAINTVRAGKKVIYIDTENNFSVERAKQIAFDHKKILEEIIFLKPASFEEQKKAFRKLNDLKSDNIGLIIVDTIATLYRLEFSNCDNVYEINRELGKQLSYLAELTKKSNIPIIVTNQVYANFENKEKVNIVGGDILKYTSKCLIELQITPNRNRRCILIKHRSIAEQKEFIFKIVDGGIIGTKEGKGFRLF